MCLPLSSFLISFVFKNLLPISLLIRVDLPTPDEPIKAIVLPFVMYFFTAKYPPSNTPLVTSMSIPMAIDSTSKILLSTSLHKSDFVNAPYRCCHTIPSN